MNKAIVTPFNAFSLLSFILLAGIALLVHHTTWPTVFLAAVGAVGGFGLIIMFLVWTLVEEVRGPAVS
jgi:drug/metabolite transporter (DMT)-like permease